jgi:hypothetical protein
MLPAITVFEMLQDPAPMFMTIDLYLKKNDIYVNYYVKKWILLKSLDIWLSPQE